MEKILIGCDDAGYALKTELIRILESKGLSVEDVGCAGPEDKTAYPLIAERLCRQLQRQAPGTRGILVCGTGIGMCICANKFKGIRAAVGHDCFSAERSILSNDCNVLCFGARVIGQELAKKILGQWLDYRFVPSHSSAKIAEIVRIENETMQPL